MVETDVLGPEVTAEGLGRTDGPRKALGAPEGKWGALNLATATIPEGPSFTLPVTSLGLTTVSAKPLRSPPLLKTKQLEFTVITARSVLDLDVRRLRTSLCNRERGDRMVR